jgi:hypothetical protein
MKNATKGRVFFRFFIANQLTCYVRKNSLNFVKKTEIATIIDVSVKKLLLGIGDESEKKSLYKLQMMRVLNHPVYT